MGFPTGVAPMVACLVLGHVPATVVMADVLAIVRFSVALTVAATPGQSRRGEDCNRCDSDDDGYFAHDHLLIVGLLFRQVALGSPRL